VVLVFVYYMNPAERKKNRPGPGQGMGWFADVLKEVTTARLRCWQKYILQKPQLKFFGSRESGGDRPKTATKAVGGEFNNNPWKPRWVPCAVVLTLLPDGLVLTAFDQNNADGPRKSNL